MKYSVSRNILIIVIIIVIIIVLLYIIYKKYIKKLLFEHDVKRLKKMYIIQKNNTNNINYEKYLFQTYHDKKKIPQDVYNNIKLYASNYIHRVYDDNEIRAFLKTFFTPRVLETFENLKKGAHKADLARYCLLYVYGGLYMDIKTELVMPLDDIFIDDNVIYSVISFKNDHIYQGIIKTKPENELFLKLIHFIVETQNPPNYIDFCKDFYNNIRKDIIDGDIKEGMNNGKLNNYYLFREKCSSYDCSMCYDGFDRYHLCCFVYDGEKPIIKTRRSSFPW